MQIGSIVKVVNFHGEDFSLTSKLGHGTILKFYEDCGEKRAEIYFSRAKMRGGYPVEMLKILAPSMSNTR